jgi:hypothetical protein
VIVNHKLIEEWQKCNLELPPYLFPGDDKLRKTNDKTSIYLSFDKYIKSSEFGSSSSKKLHLGLLPLPYLGNLAKASIFILMLNPGLSPCDYLEQKFQDFRKTLIRNLKQENANDDYPFIYLNPKFAWHRGFEYWEKKFHEIIKELAKKSKTTYQQSMSKLAQRLACLELLPYHSKSFGASSLLNNLPSTQAMLDFVKEKLLPKVENDEVIIVVTRGVKYWRLKHKKIVVYEGGETRSAHLTLKSRGGKAIAEHLGLL